MNSDDDFGSSSEDEEKQSIKAPVLTLPPIKDATPILEKSVNFKEMMKLTLEQ